MSELKTKEIDEAWLGISGLDTTNIINPADILKVGVIGHF
jgi:hypothetical protein